MKKLLAFLLFFSTSAFGQHLNPNAGDVWTNFGPTLGSGWSSGFGPSSLNSLFSNTTAHTYYAANYGPCATGDFSDIGKCINATYNTIQSSIVNVGGFLYGGGTIIIPAGQFNTATEIIQTNRTGITVRGAGGQGSGGICPTQINWTGAAGAIIFRFGDDAISTIVTGGGLESFCIDGKSLAGVGLKLLSASYGHYSDIFITNTTAHGVYQDVSATNVAGSSKNEFNRFFISQNSAGAINANGYTIGRGTTSNDSWGNKWYGLHVQYQNGIGFLCGNSDSNYGPDMFIQAISGGTGRSLYMQGGPATGPFNLSECRENYFAGVFGANNFATAPITENGSAAAEVTASQSGTTVTVTVVTSGALAVGQTLYGDSMPKVRITALGTGTGGIGTYTVNVSQTAASDAVTASYPTFDNQVQLYGMGSGFKVPILQSATTLQYNTDQGAHFSNTSGATSWIQGGMSYQATPGGNGSVFDIDTLNLSNFATVGKFGKSLPVYLMYGNPIVGFNAHWGSSAFRYGKGSVGNYGGTLGYDAATGAFTFNGATAVGDAEDTITLLSLWTVDRFGHVRVSASTAPGLTSCGTDPVISGDDRAGEVTMGTGNPTGCIITFFNPYAAAPYCTVTWQATPLASQSYAVALDKITLTQTATSSNKVNYNCLGRNGG